MDQIHDHKQGEKDQEEAAGEGGDLIHLDCALGAVDQNLAGNVVAVKGKGQLVAVHGHPDTVDNALDNFTEGQGHNGQIVAPQTQNGNADQEARDTGAQTAANQGADQPEGFGFDGQAVEHPAGNDHAGEGAHAHKSGVAQAQLTGNAHHQV